MNKKIGILSIILVVSLVAICGCLSDSQTYSDDKISFNYPNSCKSEPLINGLGEISLVGDDTANKPVSRLIIPLSLETNGEEGIKKYMSEHYGNDLKFYGKDQKNGYDHYTFEDTDDTTIYAHDVFVKNEKAYEIFVCSGIESEGDDKITEMILDTFKIK